MSVYHMHAWYPQRPEKGVRFSGTVGCELSCEFSESYSGLL